MPYLRILFYLNLLFLPTTICLAQNADSLQRIEGFLLDKSNNPLPYSHIINLSSGRGTTSSSEGKFDIGVLSSDSILFRNIAYKDLILLAGNIHKGDTIHLEIKLYSINEVKIFEWGSTYEDFKVKMMSMPVTETWGEKLGLPQQKGNPIPNYKNASTLSNPLFAITNPVDFLYFNLNKKQQSIRKVIEFNENEDLIRRFESVYNRAGISKMTGLANAELDTFLVFLNRNFQCDFHCTEVQIISEIYKKWDYYKLNESKE